MFLSFSGKKMFIPVTLGLKNEVLKIYSILQLVQKSTLLTSFFTSELHISIDVLNIIINFLINK